MNYPLSEAKEPILHALERLVEKDEALHPFIVVDKVGYPDLYVQFATKDGVLYFDVPLIKIYLEKTTPLLGAGRAVDTLSRMGIRQDERVIIHEKEDDPPRGEPFWKRIFA